MGYKQSTAGTQTGRNFERAYRQQQVHRLFDPSVGEVIDVDISIHIAEVLAGDH